jgi:xanthine dehydrogenase large subunit
MGQGLYIKVAQVVADQFQVDIDRIRVTATDTSKVPNASATAASSGADMNGMAAKHAAAKIRARMTEFAAHHFSVTEADIIFRDNHVQCGDDVLPFADLVQLAWAGRVQLSATGFYKTPKINYDRKTFSGRPFFYFAYGAAVTEVVVDVLTGENRTLRVDILHDCGDSLNPAIDRGQIEGGYVQGVGWLTSEELWWNDRGELGTHSPSTYKIPTCSDLAPDFRVEMMQSNPNKEDTIYRSKAVGEPPLMLALSAFHAIRGAISSDERRAPDLQAPATPESILNALQALKHE